MKQKFSGPPLDFIPPAYNPFIRKLASFVLPLYLRKNTGIRKLETENVESLVHLYRDFVEKKVRILIAFRHPNADDPMVLTDLFWKLLPKEANKLGIKLPITHFHFIWDRGIPLWAGEKTATLYSKLGGSPIHRGKIDWKGLGSARSLFLNGEFPLAIAPEGATNGLGEIAGPLEPGIAQLALWCKEDLIKENRNEKVIILPLGIHYEYLNKDSFRLQGLLDFLEEKLGIFPQDRHPFKMPYGKGEFFLEAQRLLRIFNRIFFFLEQYYADHYGLDPTKREGWSENSFDTRLEFIMESALTAGERSLGVSPKGNFIDRCRKLEQASWNRRFLEELRTPEKHSQVATSLWERGGEEAKRHDWHMRLTESFVALKEQYILEKVSRERISEVALLAFDTVTKILYGNGGKRPFIGAQIVKSKIGTPIEVDRIISDTRNKKESLTKIITELSNSFSDLTKL